MISQKFTTKEVPKKREISKGTVTQKEKFLLIANTIKQLPFKGKQDEVSSPLTIKNIKILNEQSETIQVNPIEKNELKLDLSRQNDLEGEFSLPLFKKVNSDISTEQKDNESTSAKEIQDNIERLGIQSVSPSKRKSPLPKRMSVIDECLDQIRQRRDLIAARLLSKGGCELDEDIFDSSDASDHENIYFSNKDQNKDKMKKSIPSEVEEECSPQTGGDSKSRNEAESDKQQQELKSDKSPLISVEKLDSVLKGTQISKEDLSGKKNQPKDQQLKEIKTPKNDQNNVKSNESKTNFNNGKNQVQKSIRASQSMTQSKKFGVSNKLNSMKSSIYQNIGQNGTGSMMSSTFRKNEAENFQGFKDRQFALQLAKMQEEEEKSAVRQLERFSDQVKTQRELFVADAAERRQNTKDFYREKRNEKSYANKDISTDYNTAESQQISKISNNNQMRMINIIDGEETSKQQNNHDSQRWLNLGQKGNSFSSSLDDCCDKKDSINYNYEDLNVGELLERFEAEFMLKRDTDPKLSQLLQASLLSATGNGKLSLISGLGQTMFEQEDEEQIEKRKKLDEMNERLKFKNISKLDLLLEKQKNEVKKLDVELMKMQYELSLLEEQKYKREKEEEQIKRDKKIAQMLEEKRRMDDSYENLNSREKNVAHEGDNEQNNILNIEDLEGEQLENLHEEYLKLKSQLSNIQQEHQNKIESQQKELLQLENENINLGSSTKIEKGTNVLENGKDNWSSKLHQENINLLKQGNKLLTIKNSLATLQTNRQLFMKDQLLDIQLRDQMVHKQSLSSELCNLKQTLQLLKDLNPIGYQEKVEILFEEIHQLKVEVENNQIILGQYNNKKNVLNSTLFLSDIENISTMSESDNNNTNQNISILNSDIKNLEKEKYLLLEKLYSFTEENKILEKTIQNQICKIRGRSHNDE